MTGTRWQNYCWRCRDYWKNQQSAIPDARDFSNDTGLSPFAGVQRRIWANREPSAGYRYRGPPGMENEPSSWGFEHMDNRSTSLARRSSSPTTRVALDEEAALPHRRPVQAASPPSLPHNPLRAAHDNYTATTSNRASSSATQELPQPSQLTGVAPTNPFGTREEWESPDYQSPLGLMFNRAWTRYRDAEDQRRVHETEIQDRMTRVSISDQSAAMSQPGTLDQTHRHPRHQTDTIWAAGYAARFGDSSEEELQRIQAMAARLNSQHGHPLSDYPLYITERYRQPSPERSNPIDTQASRPAALEPAEMTANIACRICEEQKIDCITLPCYHMTMCHWCAEIMRSDARRARRDPDNPFLRQLRGEGWNCPICRKGVEGTRRVYLAETKA
jgi:hypothetical protein